MNLKNSQKGGILSTLNIFIIAAFLFVYGVQIAFAYISQQTLKGAVRTTLVDVKTEEDTTPAKIKETIFKKISVNDIDISSDDVFVVRDGRYFIVNVNYNKEIGIAEGAKIVLDLSFEESTPR